MPWKEKMGKKKKWDIILDPSAVNLWWPFFASNLGADAELEAVVARKCDEVGATKETPARRAAAPEAS